MNYPYPSPQREQGTVLLALRAGENIMRAYNNALKKRALWAGSHRARHDKSGYANCASGVARIRATAWRRVFGSMGERGSRAARMRSRQAGLGNLPRSNSA